MFRDEIRATFPSPSPRGAPHVATVFSKSLRLVDSCSTQLKAQGPSRTCNESTEEEEEVLPKVGPLDYSRMGYSRNPFEVRCVDWEVSSVLDTACEF